MSVVRVDHLNHKKRSVVSVRVRRQSEMEKVKAFIQRQRKSTFSHLYQLRKLSPAECRHKGRIVELTNSFSIVFLDFFSHCRPEPIPERTTVALKNYFEEQNFKVKGSNAKDLVYEILFCGYHISKITK